MVVIMNLLQRFEVHSRLLKEQINRYALLGLCLSIITITIATLLASYQQSGYMDLSSAILAQKTNPALWALDFTPFLFAFWGQSFCYEMANTLESLLENKTRDLVNKSSELELKLQHQNNHDRLTNLPNQQLLSERIKQGITHLQKSDELAVIILHIRSFKEINQTYGSFNANNLLIQFTEKLKSVLLEPYFLQSHIGINMLARLQGAEFAILMPRLKKGHPMDTILQELLRGLSVNFMIDGKSVPITATAGVALYPKHGTNDHALLQHATSSLFYAENQGLSYAVYEANMALGSLEESEKIKELGHAIETEKINVWYQPEYSLKTGAIIGAEATVYIEDNQADKLSVLFEGSELIRNLTRLMFKIAIKQLALWHKAHRHISLSVSIFDVSDEELPAIIKRLLKEYKVDAEYLKVAVTEKICLSDQSKSVRLLKSLSAMGIKIVISDFASGYASFTYLANFPINEVKIDKSFLLSMGMDPKRLSIVKAIVAMGNSMDVLVHADGITDEKSLKLLKKIRCLYGQGDYLSEALEANAFLALLTNSKEAA